MGRKCRFYSPESGKLPAETGGPASPYHLTFLPPEGLRLFFKRAHEIHALLFISKHAYDETNKIYQQRMRSSPKREHTPVKIELNTGHSMIFPAALILRLSHDAINILTRQAFIMFYGSFETYLFQIFERSFPMIGIKDGILDRSITVLMGGKWDGKFNKMSENFGLGFKVGELNQHFFGI